MTESTCPSVSLERPVSETRAFPLKIHTNPEGLCITNFGLTMALPVIDQNPPLRALCVGRHRYLSDHLARFFSNLGIETRDAVGLDDALLASRSFEPEVVICEYEVLATLALEAWEKDELLSRMPVIAVSLTRRPHEAHLLDVNGIGGFLYLPLLTPNAALRVISAAAKVTRARYVPAPITTSIEVETAV